MSQELEQIILNQLNNNNIINDTFIFSQDINKPHNDIIGIIIIYLFIYYYYLFIYYLFIYYYLLFIIIIIMNTKKKKL